VDLWGYNYVNATYASSMFLAGICQITLRELGHVYPELLVDTSSIMAVQWMLNGKPCWTIVIHKYEH